MGITYYRRLWQLPYKHHVTSLFFFLLHATRRFYGSACHNYIIPPSLRSTTTWRRFLHSLFLFLAAGFLILLLSASSATEVPQNSLDPELLHYMKMFGGEELCVQELKGPFNFLKDLDIEIGLIINGTLFFRFSPHQDKLPTEKDMTFDDISVQRNGPEVNRLSANNIGDDLVQSLALDPEGNSVQDSENVERKKTDNSNALDKSLQSVQVSENVAGNPSFRSDSVQHSGIHASGKSSLQNSDSNGSSRKHSLRVPENTANARTSVSRCKRSTDLANSPERISEGYARKSSTVHNSQNSTKLSSSTLYRSRRPLLIHKGYFANDPSSDEFLIRPSKKRVSHDLFVTSRSWEPVTGDKDHVFVYSAFYDDRRGQQKSNMNRRVCVLGIGVYHPLVEYPSLKKQVFCHFRWKSSPQLHVRKRGVIESIREDKNLTYHAIFILCDLNLCASPDYVGVTLDRRVLPRSYLQVQYPPVGNLRHRYNVTTCFPVMHSYYHNTEEFLQVVETGRLLGTQKFTLYVHDASPQIMRIIKHYVTSGVMEAIDWKLPLRNLSELHYFGQMAAVNDCVYQSMYYSKHVVFHDFDEILLPRLHDTWTNMLEEFQQQSESLWERFREFYGGRAYGCYTFLHVFFPKNWTHPGLPGNYVIEGSDTVVEPGSVQPFVYGFKDWTKSPEELAKELGGEKGGDGKVTENKDKEEKVSTVSKLQQAEGGHQREKSEQTFQEDDYTVWQERKFVGIQQQGETNGEIQQGAVRENFQQKDVTGGIQQRILEENFQQGVGPENIQQEETQSTGLRNSQVSFEEHLERVDNKQKHLSQPLMRTSAHKNISNSEGNVKTSKQTFVERGFTDSKSEHLYAQLPPNSEESNKPFVPTELHETHQSQQVPRVVHQVSDQRTHVRGSDKYIKEQEYMNVGHNTLLQEHLKENDHNPTRQFPESDPKDLIFSSVLFQNHDRNSNKHKLLENTRLEQMPSLQEQYPSNEQMQKLGEDKTEHLDKKRLGDHTVVVDNDKITRTHNQQLRENLQYMGDDIQQFRKDLQHTEVPTNLDLPALRLTWRENIIWASNWRSKMLVKPEAVLMMGIHNVHVIMPGFQNRDLTADEALVHHYRDWWVRKGTVMVHDTTALNLERLLRSHVEKTLKQINDEDSRVCGKN